jgi:hypothetical protein
LHSKTFYFSFAKPYQSPNLFLIQMQAAVPRLKIAFESPRFSGEQFFDKTKKNETRVRVFLASLHKQHAARNKQRGTKEKLSVQITTV